MEMDNLLEVVDDSPPGQLPAAIHAVSLSSSCSALGAAWHNVSNRAQRHSGWWRIIMLRCRGRTVDSLFEIRVADKDAVAVGLGLVMREFLMKFQAIVDLIHNDH